MRNRRYVTSCAKRHRNPNHRRHHGAHRPDLSAGHDGGGPGAVSLTGQRLPGRRPERQRRRLFADRPELDFGQILSRPALSDPRFQRQSIAVQRGEFQRVESRPHQPRRDPGPRAELRQRALFRGAAIRPTTARYSCARDTCSNACSRRNGHADRDRAAMRDVQPASPADPGRRSHGQRLGARSGHQRLLRHAAGPACGSSAQSLDRRRRPIGAGNILDRQFGVLGERRVNVLDLNLAPDAMRHQGGRNGRPER